MSKLPSPDEVRELVKDKIITQEEAREILFSEEEFEETPSGKKVKLVKQEELESEIKFLRDLVEKLSNNNRSTIVETIKYIDRPYYRWGWYKEYDVWCKADNNTQLLSRAGTQQNAIYSLSASNGNFSAIKTF